MSDQQGDGSQREKPRGTQKKRRTRPSTAVASPRETSKRRRSSRQPRNLPDADASLEALAQLPGLLAMGLITTGQANSMRGIYSTMLQELNRRQTSRSQTQLDDADIMQLLRDNPGMLNMLAPLLTDDQIDAVMEDLAEEGDGQA